MIEESGGSSWSGTGANGEYLGGGSSSTGVSTSGDWMGAAAAMLPAIAGMFGNSKSAGGQNYTKKTTNYDKDLYEAIRNMYSNVAEDSALYNAYYSTNFANDLYDVDALMKNYTNQAKTSIGQNYQNLARSAGTTDSSIVNALQANAITDADTQLMAKEAELTAANEQAKLENALSGMSNTNQASAIYLDALKEPTETMTYAKKKKSKWGSIGSLAGGAVGAVVGGPAGAGVGASIGGAAGGMFD